MDEKQLAELEMHLAAGTDFPTAMAAVQHDAPTRRASPWAYVAAVVVFAVVFWLLR
jgi:hypothetical protein